MHALQGYKHTFSSQKEEKNGYIEYNQMLFSQCGYGRSNKENQEGFNSKGKVFNLVGRYKKYKFKYK